MTNNSDKSVVSFLLDETGSMSSVKGPTISGFNEYIETLRAGGTPTSLRMMTFNTSRFSVPYELEDVRNVSPLDSDSYMPNAQTNLYDAIAKLIYDTDGLIGHMSLHPKVVCTIMTDGLENASTEHTREMIFDLISERERNGWAFAYLGANQDAWAISESLGIDPRASYTYEPHAPNLMLAPLARRTTSFLTGQFESLHIKQERKGRRK